MPAVLRLLGIVVSIGLADSLNPTTIAPALYLATGERARGRVAEFTVAVFIVYLLGGIAIALGPGQLVLSLVARPGHEARHLIEVGAGVAMLVAAAMLWRHRRVLALRDPPDFDPRGKSSAVLGATITVIELPTAFPYFAAIAAVVGSGVGVTRQLFLLLVFNLCFVLPLIGIVATLAFAGPRAERALAARTRLPAGPLAGHRGRAGTGGRGVRDPARADWAGRTESQPLRPRNAPDPPPHPPVGTDSRGARGRISSLPSPRPRRRPRSSTRHPSSACWTAATRGYETSTGRCCAGPSSHR
jgi:cytochrome c biogenesis protein CcdA